jgi:hypothetical protein
VFLFLEKLCRLYFDEHAWWLLLMYQQRQLENLTQTIKKWQMTLRISLSILRFHNLWFVSTNWLLKAAILFLTPWLSLFPIRTTYRRGIMVVIRKWRLYCNSAFSCFRTQTFNRKQ